MKIIKYILVIILSFTLNLGFLSAQEQWVSPIANDKQELAIQKIVQIVNKRWWDFKKKILSQLKGMESKINPDKKPILDRLMYLIGSDGTMVIQNKRKNIPKNSSGGTILISPTQGWNSTWALDYSRVKYWVWISALQTTGMDFSKPDVQSLSFVIGFGDAIYDEVWKTSLLSRDDTFWFQIENVTSWYKSDSADYFPVYGWAKQIFEVWPEFFWNKNWLHHIRIKLMSLKMNRYENYFHAQNLTEFSINVTWISTVKKKISNENVDYCKTQIWDVIYSLEPCWITTEFTKWNWNKDFSFKIHTSSGSALYGYGIHWNMDSLTDRFKVQWLPDKSIDWWNSDWWATWDSTIEKYFSDEKIKTWSYSWYLSILIDQWRDRKELKFPIKLKVLPSDPNKIIDYCKTQFWDIIYYLDPCSMNLTMIKWKWNVDYSFYVTNKEKIRGVSFNLGNNIEWFPQFTLQWWAVSWGADGKIPVDKYLPEDKFSIWKYSWYIPISIYDAWKKARELRLFIILKVE